MGFNEGLRIWRKGAETVVGDAEKRDMHFSELVERSRVQAENYATAHGNEITAFIGAGHRDTILNATNKLSAAQMIARNEPYIIPDTIEDLDHQAAFLIALAEELNKDEYRQ